MDNRQILINLQQAVPHATLQEIVELSGLLDRADMLGVRVWIRLVNARALQVNARIIADMRTGKGKSYSPDRKENPPIETSNDNSTPPEAMKQIQERIERLLPKPPAHVH